MARAETQAAIEIAGVQIKPGNRKSIDIPLPSFYTHSSVNMPVHVVHGRRPGPVLLVSAAVHGDEINGVEIIRRLLTQKSIDRLKGTLTTSFTLNVQTQLYRELAVVTGIPHHRVLVVMYRMLNAFLSKFSK